MAAYTRRDWQELDNKGDVGGTGALRTEPNPQDGRSNAALARIVYDPANGHKLRLTGEYLDTDLYTNGLTGVTSTVDRLEGRSEEHTSELQSLLRISYAVFCLQKKQLKL